MSERALLFAIKPRANACARNVSAPPSPSTPDRVIRSVIDFWKRPANVGSNAIYRLTSRGAEEGRVRKRDAHSDRRDEREKERENLSLARADSASYSKCERMQIPYLMSGIFKGAERWMEHAGGTGQYGAICIWYIIQSSLLPPTCHAANTVLRCS